MKEVTNKSTDECVIIALSGRIDSTNAAEAEKEAASILTGKMDLPVILDLAELEYISSAGLRSILHLRKNKPELRLINVNSEVYEILDMTGFTQMMTVEKAYRVVSIEGCEEIGRGANGSIYRIDKDNVVKVYRNPDALEDIQHEREVARTALILGIPTAISYDVVKVGESYGSVYEMLNARSFSKILVNEPEKIDWCVEEYVKMLRKIHGTLVPEGKLPDMRQTAIGWADFVKDYLPEEQGRKLVKLVNDVPEDNHMIHGDYHTKNLELQDDEVLLIDMDTLAVGYPIFELGSIFNAFIGFSELDHEIVKKFQGFDYEIASEFWHKSLAAYLGTKNPDKIREVEDKARIIGYTRLIRRSIRRGGLEDEARKAEIDHWTSELIELLDKTDTLLFETNEFDVEAEIDRLHDVIDFVEQRLEEAGCSPREMMPISVAVEEVFVNVAHYAYKTETGFVKINVDMEDSPRAVTITFTDRGVPFNPLEHGDPDINLPAEEREIGGLGIFMVKESMDDVSYEYKDGQNILTFKKFF